MKKGNDKLKGIIYSIISGISFGIMPVWAKLAYSEGANAISTLAFRFLLSAALLLGYLLIRKVSLRVNLKQFKLILLLAVGYSLTSIFLFYAYNYINVGIATMILYTYPIMVMMLSIMIYKEKFKFKKFIYLILTTLGVCIMVGPNGGHVSTLGVILVLLSGLSYAVYVIGTAHEEIKKMDSLVMTFYISLITALVDFVIGFFNGSFTTVISPRGMVYILLLAIVSTVIGLIAFLKGVWYIGPTDASIFSSVEPVVSLVLGVVILGEFISINIIAGSVIIIAVMIFLSRDTVGK